MSCSSRGVRPSFRGLSGGRPFEPISVMSQPGGVESIRHRAVPSAPLQLGDPGGEAFCRSRFRSGRIRAQGRLKLADFESPLAAAKEKIHQFLARLGGTGVDRLGGDEALHRRLEEGVGLGGSRAGRSFKLLATLRRSPFTRWPDRGAEP